MANLWVNMPVQSSYNMKQDMFSSFNGSQPLYHPTQVAFTPYQPYPNQVTAPYNVKQEPAFINVPEFDIQDTPTNYASEGQAPENDFYNDAISITPSHVFSQFQASAQVICDVVASKDTDEFDIYKLPPARESSDLSSIEQLLKEEIDSGYGSLSPSPHPRLSPIPEQDDTDDCVLDRQIDNISPDEGATTKRRRITHKKTDQDSSKANHVCQVCGRRFVTKGNLQNHMRRHTGEKPYNCNHCGKRFTQISSLKTHVRVHTGERPYQCTVCHRSFSDYSTCAKHERIHSGERPYTCDICGRSFTQSGNMLRHKRSHAK